MTNEKNYALEETTLTLIETIRTLVLGEVRSIIYDHQGAAFMKFLLIATCVEYLGACLDEHSFDKEGESENRFNTALKKLFPKKYHQFSKKGANVYLFDDFRCRLVHQLRPSKSIGLTHREEARQEKTSHLQPVAHFQLVLILEEFYDDLETAAKKTIRLFETKKITNTKGDKEFLLLTSLRSKS